MWLDNNPFEMFDTGSAAAQTGGGLWETANSVVGSPIGSLVGSAIGGIMGGNSADKSWSRQKKMFLAQKDFAEYMANTQYRRTVKDMWQAGLNPILAATKGPGALPGMPSSGSPPDESAQVSSRISSAVQATRAAADIGLIRAETRLKEAQRLTELNQPENVSARTSLTKAEETTTGYRNANLMAQTGLYGAQEGQTRAQTAYTQGPMTDLAWQHVKESKAKVQQLVSSAKLADAQKLQTEMQQDYTAVQIAAAEEQLKGQLLEGEIDQTQYGAAMRYLKRLSTSITGLGSNARSLAH